MAMTNLSTLIPSFSFCTSSLIDVHPIPLFASLAGQTLPAVLLQMLQVLWTTAELALL